MEKPDEQKTAQNTSDQGCCGGPKGGRSSQKGMPNMAKMMSEGGPMGMDMATKMMGQMGSGGPMEMMQKMMAQMAPSDSKPPMEKMMGMCMGMCGEMLSAIAKTNALAVSATPELQHAFGEWLMLTEDEAMKLISNGTTDTTALASALKLSEESTRYVLTRLAESGKISLAAIAKNNGD